jgi:hypothetical protein
VRKHRLDPFSLVFGATFTLLGSLFLFARADIEDLHLKWIWPLPLIVLGALIIALSVREGRSREGLSHRTGERVADTEKTVR